MAAINYKPTTLDGAVSLYNAGNLRASEATAMKRYSVAVAIVLGKTSSECVDIFQLGNKSYPTPIRKVLKSLDIAPGSGKSGLTALHAVGYLKFGEIVKATIRPDDKPKTTTKPKAKTENAPENAPKAEAPAPTVDLKSVTAGIDALIRSANDTATIEAYYAAILDAAKRARREAARENGAQVAA